MTTKLPLSRSVGGMAAALLAMIASMPALAQPIAITGATLAIGDGSIQLLFARGCGWASCGCPRGAGGARAAAGLAFP